MKKRKKIQSLRKRILLIMSVSLMLIMIILYVFNLSFSRIHKLLLEKDMEQIEFTSNYVIKLVYTEIENFLSALEASQKRILKYTEEDTERLSEELRDIKKDIQLEKVGVIDLTGNIIDDAGNTENIETPLFMDNIRNKNIYISDVVDISDAIFMAVPIIKGDEVKGAIWGYFFVSRIAEKIELAKDSPLYFQIIDNTGTYISDSNNVNAFAQSTNLWEELKKYEMSGNTSIENIKSDVEEGRSGYFKFVYKGNGRHVTYEPLGIKNWYIFSVMVEEYLGNYIKEIEVAFSKLLTLIIGAVIFVTGLLGTFVYKGMSLIKGQNEKLLAKNKLLFMVLAHTNDIPFEIDISKKTISFYRDKNDKKMMLEKLDDYAPENMIREEKIVPEEYENYQRFYQSILSGGKAENIILKTKRKNRWEYRKVHVEVISQGHSIGFLEDCTEQILQNKRIQEISIKVQKDSLTGLYSRDYFIQKVEKIMQEAAPSEEGKYSALFLLDLDHFKQANDTLGHIMGDRILEETGRTLKSILREEDLIGRLGGDEFVVFIQNSREISGVKKCAEKINDALCKTYGEKKKVNVSVSIGIVVWTREKNFAQLYKIADTALYKVKENKRNGHYIMWEDIK